MSNEMTTSAPLKRLVILISGGGSNLQAIINAIAAKTIPATIACVISNKPGVYGLERAKEWSIPSVVLEHTAFASREDYDAALLALVQSYEPDLIVLAGFMRILSSVFVEPYYGKILNIHPSLLPKYPGLHTHELALKAGDAEGGATIHFVSAELDAGPAIVQAAVPAYPNDDIDTLATRVLKQEHINYPLIIKWFCEGRLRCENNIALLDNVALPQYGRRV
jgi:phosphoribosylglycinamide formyltransferase-1